ncbi:MAG: LLM class flavin-dependent oxidoreductase, partial [Proteobacteria bacterium]|nr:LLM class flavin-dependent oxidoreductase [Pseudomonadota bacterium]
MKFGIFYEHQLPRPWHEHSEYELLQNSLREIELADRLGYDYAWEVEHHFLEEYSHSSAPEVFLAAASQRTKQIRLAHGIIQLTTNHPARVAERVSTLDLLSHGRVEFGIGEGATRLELHGYDIQAKRKQALSFEAAEQIANMMVMEPYPGYEGEGFSLPCRNVIPKPVQKPHPPMWLACTNRKTIETAARNGLGALAFSFVDPEEAKIWAETYYSIVRSAECVPLGHTVNANIAVVTGFSLHNDKLRAFITVSAERARSRALELETELERGEWRGPLHGIPIALKDNIDTAGVKTTAGSAVFRNRIPEEDAEVVIRLEA